ncbi:UNKNOWN [Stylonychia lemnae]|uniref:Uncharacterized protein n=1 Tax=Stylonychia lemnae TaxID=5949 RepID=A0A078A4P7_STYLE|nr:UNKNOWN [Stylonychia lemnae]|eukprot:CDW76478.1 UNKNOWN [Stylonychia lemnae]
MALRDPELVQQMKQTIKYQQDKLNKKSKLLLAIKNNIDYLTGIYKDNQRDLYETRTRNKFLVSENQELQAINESMKVQLDKFKKDSELLFKEQQKIKELIMEQENSQVELESLHMAIQLKNDKMLKLEFDMQVMQTEKQAYIKELDRQDQEIRGHLKELKELKIRHELLTDENVKNLKQNADYRDLIVNNEDKMNNYREELSNTQRVLQIRNEQIGRYKEDEIGFKQQIAHLEQTIQNFRNENNELLEQNKKMIYGGGLVVSDEQLKMKFQTLSNDYEFKKKEWDANESRLVAQLKFSRESNENLKNDYDLLQDKFEAYMRANNSINEDLKKEFEELQSKHFKVNYLYEELQKDFNERLRQEVIRYERREDELIEELKKKDEDLTQTQKELSSLQGEIKLKMTKLKVLEYELKNQKANEDDKERKIHSQMSVSDGVSSLSTNKIQLQPP